MSYLSEAMFAGNRELSETEVNDGKFNFTFETKDGETYDIKASNSDDAITNFHKAYPTVQDDDIIALYDESDIHYCPVSGEELDEQKLNELFNANISPNFSPNINLDLSGGGAASLLGLLGESSEHGFSVGDKVYYVEDEPRVPGDIIEIYEDGTCDIVVNNNPDDIVNVDMKMLDYWDDSQMECTMTEDTVKKSNGKELREVIETTEVPPEELSKYYIMIPGVGRRSVDDPEISEGDSLYYEDGYVLYLGDIINRWKESNGDITITVYNDEDSGEDDEGVAQKERYVFKVGSLTEDTVKKSNGKWTNRGDDGKEHGEFKTKKKADAQRKAMYANGYKGESKKAVREWYVGEPSDYAANGRSYYSDPKGWKEKLATVEDLVNSNPDIYISGSTSWKACVSDIYGNPLYQFDFWEDKKSFEDQLKEFSAISKSVNLYKLNRDKLKKRVTEAPDMFGLPTDDELDAEFDDIRAKFDQRRQDIEASRQSNIKDLVNKKAFIIDPQARLVYKDGPYYIYECPDDFLTPDEFESRMRKLRYNKVEPKYDETSRYEKDGITIEYYDDSPAKFSIIVPRKSVMSRGLPESKKRVTESLQVGDKIRIEFMEGEPQYTGKEGVVTHISKDPWGDTAIYGTWGGCSLYPSAGDSYTILSKDGDLDEGKKLCEYEDDPYENYDDDTTYIDYDEAEFARDDLGFDKEDIGKYTWGNVRSKYESKKRVNESTSEDFSNTLISKLEELKDTLGVLETRRLYDEFVKAGLIKDKGESKKRVNEGRKRFERPDSHMDMVKSSPIYDFVVPALRRMFDDLEVDSSIITQFGPWQELVDAAAELVLRYDEYMADNYDDSVVSESKKRVTEDVSFSEAMQAYLDDASVLHSNSDRDAFEADNWHVEVEDVLIDYDEQLADGLPEDRDATVADYAKYLPQEAQDKIVKIYQKRFGKYESKKEVKESTDDGIRVRQLRNNIEEICDEYLNGIYDGYNEPFSSTDELVDYVYSQVFDLKSNGGGYTRYGTGICRDLKYLGKDFIVNEIIKYGQDILAEDVITESKKVEEDYDFSNATEIGMEEKDKDGNAYYPVYFANLDKTVNIDSGRVHSWDKYRDPVEKYWKKFADQDDFDLPDGTYYAINHENPYQYWKSTVDNKYSDDDSDGTWVHVKDVYTDLKSKGLLAEAINPVPAGWNVASPYDMEDDAWYPSNNGKGYTLTLDDGTLICGHDDSTIDSADSIYAVITLISDDFGTADERLVCTSESDMFKKMALFTPDMTSEDTLDILQGNAQKKKKSVKSVDNYEWDGTDSKIPRNIVNLVVSEGVKKIPDRLFEDQKYLRSIVLPNSLEEIGSFAFSGCKQLKSVVIPENVLQIGFGAFANCSSLESVEIPMSVRTILGMSVFSYCSAKLVITTDNPVAQKYCDKEGLKWTPNKIS